MSHLPPDQHRSDFRSRRPYHLPPPPPPYYPPPRYDYDRRDYRDRDRDSYITANYDETFRRGISRFESHPANTHVPRRPVDAWVPNQGYAEKERQEREKRAKEMVEAGSSGGATAGERAKEDGEDDSSSVRSRETRPRDDRHYVPPPHRFAERPRGRSRSPGWRPRQSGSYVPDYSYGRSRSRSPPPRRGYDYPPPRRRTPPRYRRRSISPVAPLRGRPPPRRRSRHPSRSTTLSRSRSRSFSRSPRSRSRSYSPPRSNMFRLGSNRSPPHRARHPSPPPLVHERPMEPRALSNRVHEPSAPATSPPKPSSTVSAPAPASISQPATPAAVPAAPVHVTDSVPAQAPQPPSAQAPASAPAEPEPTLPPVDKGKQKAREDMEDVTMADPSSTSAQNSTSPALLLPRSVQSKSTKPLPKGPRSHLQPVVAPSAPRPVVAPVQNALPSTPPAPSPVNPKPSFLGSSAASSATPTAGTSTPRPPPTAPLSASLPPRPAVEVLTSSIQRRASALDSPMHVQSLSPMRVPSPHSRTQSPAQMHISTVPPTVSTTAPAPLEPVKTNVNQHLTTNEELNKYLIEMKISKPPHNPSAETDQEKYARLGYPEGHWMGVQQARAIAKKISDRVPERRKKQMEKRQAYFELEMAMLDVKCAERRTKASGTVLSMLLDEGDVGIM